MLNFSLHRFSSHPVTGGWLLPIHGCLARNLECPRTLKNLLGALSFRPQEVLQACSLPSPEEMRALPSCQESWICCSSRS